MKLDPSNLLKGLAENKLKTEKAVYMYGETAGKKLEGKAKKGAKWTDRTGRARGTMTGGAEQIAGGTRIYLSGNMDYSIFLELCNEKKYAIIDPTMKENSKEIIEGLSKIFK